MKEIPEFMQGHELLKFGPEELRGSYMEATHEPVASLEDAHLVSSKMAGAEFHRPVLDIDFGAALIPSTTPGHFHLYLDKLVSWSEYEELLVLLARIGIIEDGFANMSIERGYSDVRLPGVIKGAEDQV